MSKTVKVVARPGAGDLIDWEIDGQKAKNSKIEFKKGEGPATVVFELKDKTNQSLRFDRQNPIWIHENESGQCPPRGATDSQIDVLGCDDETLTLVNKNEKESTLRYQLNFFDHANEGAACDPEFKNGGHF